MRREEEEEEEEEEVYVMLTWNATTEFRIILNIIDAGRRDRVTEKEIRSGFSQARLERDVLTCT